MENNDMNTETKRREFEEWITAMPYERDITRRPNDFEKYAFPNTYVDYQVDLAWEAWQAAREQVTEQRDEWKAKYIQQNKDLGYELRDPNGTIWSECKRLQTELTAARQEIDMLKSKYADHHAEAERLTSEIRSVAKQRDRLAVALRELRNNKSMSLGGAAYEIVEQALQSLTTNEQ